MRNTLTVMIVLGLLWHASVGSAATCLDDGSFANEHDADGDADGGDEICVGGDQQMAGNLELETTSALVFLLGDTITKTCSTDQYFFHRELGLAASDQLVACKNGIMGEVTIHDDWNTSSEIADNVGNETGSGALVFGTNPTVDFTTGAVTIQNSTSAGSTVTGRVHLDTNGGTSTVPMTTVGDGTNAIPARMCWAESMMISAGLNATTYAVPSGTIVATDQHGQRYKPVQSVVLAGLRCQSYQEAADTATVVFTVEKATLSACTFNNAAATTACTWAAGPTCTITGTASGLQAETECSDLTTKTAVATTEVYHLKAATTGVWTNRIWSCNWMACAEAVW